MPRKKPFSNKQKKEQLQQKRKQKKDKCESRNFSSNEDCSLPLPVASVRKLHHHESEGTPKQYDPNRFCLHFEESREDLERRKQKAKECHIIPKDEAMLEVDIDDVYIPDSVLDMPKRPAWSYDMTKAEQEEDMFKLFLEKIHSQYPSQNLSYFEHNLETWRQLWRVLEILHFSPALYTHVVNELKKPLLLVLNKVDLVPVQVAIAWKHYFQLKFSQLHIICFTCYPSKDPMTEHIRKVQMKFRKRNHILTAIGKEDLILVIEEILKDRIVREDVHKHAMPMLKQETTKQDVLTVGLVGHPNVGKSSILNALIGRKCVSTSRTPGHTKHLQTIFLSQRVQLCDCPGLVFPSFIDKQLQILSGIYPISQVKEPYTSIGYLAERIPLVDLLQLTHPDGMITQDTTINPMPESKGSVLWTAWDICDAWAEKKGYYTSKSRPDTFRAANHLLRLASDGRICLFFKPPGYSVQLDYWKQHPETLALTSLQQEKFLMCKAVADELSLSESESESESESSDQSEENIDCHKNKFDSLIDFNDSN